jgi:predicted MFS family arabinose efflux permease
VLAALPLIGFRGFGRHQEEAGGGPVEAMRLFVPDRSLGQFLAALGLWHFATGAFNPFFNVYLARAMRFPVETVGVLFTTSQIAQVVAMQFSPMLLRWLGLVRGIAATQALAGLALVGLGVAGQPMLAALLFPLFMALQYMTEPGIFTRLMQGLPSGSARAGASAWNFAIVFTTHSLAAWMAGEAIARFGYSPVWSAAGILVLLAAWAMTRVTSER